MLHTPRLTAAVLLLLSCASGRAQTSAAGTESEPLVVYRGATLIDGTGAPARTGMSIIVRGETISAVVPDAQAPTDVRSVDAGKLFVLPGLIDTHVHLATPPNARRARAVLRRLAYSGVTAVRDMADDLRSVGELAREARVAEIPAPDIYYAALMAGPTFFDDPRTHAVTRGGVPGHTPWMQAVDDATDMPLAVAMARGTAATAIKLYANMPGPLLAKITAEAHRQGIAVWAHAAVFPAMPSDNVAAGVDVISHSCPLAYQVSKYKPTTYQDPAPVDEAPFKRGMPGAMTELFDDMARKGIILDATNRVYVEHVKEYARTHSGRPPRCSAELTYRLTAQAHAQGVDISTGTDGETPWSAPYPALHEELELLAGPVGMSTAQVIHSATQVAARAAGQEQNMGTIAAGKLANLVFVARDPLADIGNLRSVVFTVKRGVMLARKDYLPTTEAEYGPEEE